MEIIELSAKEVKRLIIHYYEDMLNYDIYVKEIISVQDGKTNIQIFLCEDMENERWSLLTYDEIKTVLTNYANELNYDLESFIFFAGVDSKDDHMVPTFEGIRLNVKKKGLKKLLSENEKAS